MGMCTARESGVGTLCCHLKPADVQGSWNSETVQPREWSAVLVPDTLICSLKLCTLLLKSYGYPTENLLFLCCPRENLECGLDQNVQ